MQSLKAICLGLVATALLIWVLWPAPRRSSSSVPDAEQLDQKYQRDVSFVLGFYTGLPGAAVAKYALSRLEEGHGRKATPGEIGFVVGLIVSWAW